MLTWMLSWNGFLDACPAAVQEPDNSAYSPLLVAFDRLDGLTDLDEATTATLKASRVLFARVLFLKNIIPSGRNHRDLHLQRHPAHSRISAGRLRCPSRVLLKKREGSIVLSPGAFAFAFHLGFVC